MNPSKAQRTIILYVGLFVSIILLAVMWQINRYVAGLPPLLQIPNYQVNRVTLTDQLDGAKIKPEDLLPACAGPDCLRSLDQPRFETATTADTWLQDDDRIIGLVFKGVSRAYPIKILNYHPVINDVINLNPILIAYSPLTGSSAIYRPLVNEIQTQFGVSGLVRHSDLVLYDRLQGNLWQQISGQAILGPAALANEALQPMPLSYTRWNIWKQAHPDTTVLSQSTGLSLDYSQSPYSDYEDNDELRLQTTYTNKTLPAKDLVYGLKLGSFYKAYPDSLITDTPTQDYIGNTSVTIQRQADGTVVVTNTKTNELLYPRPSYWFAWNAFYPESRIYQTR